MLEVAEASLSELQDAISNVSARLLPDLSLEIEPEILAEVSILLVAGNANTAKVMANQTTTLTRAGAAEKEEEKEDRKGEREEKEQVESIMG